MSTIDSESAVSHGTKDSMSDKYVYYFGDGSAEGHGNMKDVLGGKGAGLAEMTLADS